MSFGQNRGQPPIYQKRSRWPWALQFCLTVNLLPITGCSWGTRNIPSVLVVAVEGLGFSRQTCGEVSEKKENDGFVLVCRESTRFTHAFTPANLSQSALASLMTGLYPHETGVFHNGPQALSEEIVTVAELALSSGYRTAFFSGGPPIFHRSGLGQGFEVFEDSLTRGQTYRSSQENLKAFKRWLNQESKPSPFFSVLYFNDLMFTDVTTFSQSGEVLPGSKLGRERQLSETLFELRNYLKQDRKWNSTWVFVVGLNALKATLTDGQIDPVDLSSKSTQVTLLVKSPSRNADEGKEQTVDARVSLADVGETLFDLIGRAKPPPMSAKKVESFSLRPLIEGKKVTYFENRMIPQVAAWADWRDQGSQVASARQGNYLFINSKTPQFFNTLIDRFETNAISVNDPLWRTVAVELQKFLIDLEYLPATEIQQNYYELSDLEDQLFSIHNSLVDKAEEGAIELSPSLKRNKIALNWVVGSLVQKNKWVELLEFAKANNYRALEILSAQHLNKTLSFAPKGCEAALLWRKKDYRKLSVQECSDSIFISLVDWILRQNGDPGSGILDNFALFQGQVLWKDWLSKKNARLGFVLDISIVPSPRPSLSEIYLLLPRNQRFKKLVDQRILLKNPNLTLYPALKL